MQKAIRAFLFLTTATLLSGPMSTRAQEKPKADDKAPVTVHPTPLKVQIVFTEFEGDKKVKSLPYNLVVVADGRPPNSKLRMGSRVPVYTGKENGMQYYIVEQERYDNTTEMDCAKAYDGDVDALSNCLVNKRKQDEKCK